MPNNDDACKVKVDLDSVLYIYGGYQVYFSMQAIGSKVDGGWVLSDHSDTTSKFHRFKADVWQDSNITKINIYDQA